jgi:hypothetical protein
MGCLGATTTPFIVASYPSGYPKRKTVNVGKRLHHRKVLYYLDKFGAGDEIRTHDPNLGKWIIFGTI